MLPPKNDDGNLPFVPTEVGATAAFFKIALHNRGYASAIRGYHPEFYDGLRSTVNILLQYTDYSLFTDDLTKSQFEALSNEELAKLILDPIPIAFMKLDNLAVLHEFTIGDITYVAVKLNPKRGQILGPHAELVPMVKVDSEWLVRDHRLFDRIDGRVISFYAVKYKNLKDSEDK